MTQTFIKWIYRDISRTEERTTTWAATSDLSCFYTQPVAVLWNLCCCGTACQELLLQDSAISHLTGTVRLGPRIFQLRSLVIFSSTSAQTLHGRWPMYRYARLRETSVREETSSNFGWRIGYPDCGFRHCFQFFKLNIKIIPHTMLRPLSLRYVTVHCV
jgi:hypothetical protein